MSNIDTINQAWYRLSSRLQYHANLKMDVNNEVLEHTLSLV